MINNLFIERFKKTGMGNATTMPNLFFHQKDMEIVSIDSFFMTK